MAVVAAATAAASGSAVGAALERMGCVSWWVDSKGDRSIGVVNDERL